MLNIAELPLCGDIILCLESLVLHHSSMCPFSKGELKEQMETWKTLLKETHTCAVAQLSQGYPATNLQAPHWMGITARVRKIAGLWYGDCTTAYIHPRAAQSVVSSLVIISKSRPPYSKGEQCFEWRRFIPASACSGTGKGPGSIKHYLTKQTRVSFCFEDFGYIAAGSGKWNTVS